MTNIKKIDLQFISLIFKKAINSKEKLTLDSKFEQVKGWDSLGHMKILSAIEKNLKVTFEIDEIVGINTIKKLVSLIKKKL